MDRTPPHILTPLAKNTLEPFTAVVMLTRGYHHPKVVKIWLNPSPVIIALCLSAPPPVLRARTMVVCITRKCLLRYLFGTQEAAVVRCAGPIWCGFFRSDRTGNKFQFQGCDLIIQASM